MARRATWIVILALVLMPLLGGGSGPRAFAQDGGSDQTVETVDPATTSEETADEGNTTEGDGETGEGETETVEPTPTETPTETPTIEATATEEATPTESPTEEPVPSATVEPSATPEEPSVTETATTAPTTAPTATSTPKPSSTPSKIKAAAVETSTPVVKKSDIVVTINCTGQPERVRVTNNGAGTVTVLSIGSIYGTRTYEPITVNKRINGGKTYEWTIGPDSSTNNRLYPVYIFTNTAYDLEGAIVNTSVGSITKKCPASPPTKLSDIEVTINCTSDPEKIRVTNEGSQPITVYWIGSLYSKVSGEPFVVNKTVVGDSTRAWSAGPKATGNYVLTKSFIFTNSAFDKDGITVATSSGNISVRCPSKPADPFNGAKWIEVNLSTQYLIAWQNGVRVNETYVSTGRPGFDTPTGTWYINYKLTSQTMSGCIQGECYYVPDVPWVMYFTDWGHALHGTYWHSKFGQTMSHGCVNLTVSFAEWLYYWTPYGTPVVVHY